MCWQALVSIDFVIRRRKAKDLVDGGLPCNQASADQFSPGALQGPEFHGKSFHNGFITVIAQAFVVADAYQEKVQGRGRVADPVKIFLTNQAVIDPAEAFGYFAHPVG